jgi:molecular chaperone DnaJ
VAKRDYYEVLGVGRDATDAQIKTAYRTQAIKVHPDKNPGDKHAEEKFKELNEAYSVLCDGEKRRLYDQLGHAGVDGSRGGGGFQGGGFEGFGNFGDIFGDMFEQAFGGGAGGRRESGARSGRDLRVDRDVTLLDVLNGIDVNLDIPALQTCETCSGTGARPGSGTKQCSQCRGHGQVRVSHGFFQMAQTCPKCHGQGEIIENPCPTCSGSGRTQKTKKVKVRIPPGVENGTTLRITNAGEAGERGSSAGDLYVVVHVKGDKRFERDGANLITEASISFPMAALGGEIDVASLDGTVRLKIPAGTQPGVHFRIADRGLPQLKSRSRGDLFVKVQVNVPKKLSKEEKKLVQELGAKFGDTHLGADDGVFKRVFGG